MVGIAVGSLLSARPPVDGVTDAVEIGGDALLGGVLALVSLVVAGYLLVRFSGAAVAVAGPLFGLSFVVAAVLFLREGR